MRTLIALLLLAAATGCDSTDDQAVYVGVLSAPDGTTQFEAELEFPRPATGDMTEGTYELVSVDGARRDGRAQASSGGDGTLSVFLDVGASDSGTQLVGTPVGDRFAGVWSELTIAGEVPAGTFDLRLRD